MVNKTLRTVFSLVLVAIGAAMLIPTVITVFQDFPVYYLVIISIILIFMGTMIKLTTDIKKREPNKKRRRR